MQETQEIQVGSLGQENLEEGMATHPVFLPGKSYGQRSLEAYSPQGHRKSDTIEVTEHANTMRNSFLTRRQLFKYIAPKFENSIRR